MREINQDSPQAVRKLVNKLKATQRAGKFVEVILDTETTGKDSKKDRLVEFGAVIKVEGQVVAKVNFLVNAWHKDNKVKLFTKFMPKGAFEVHGISKELAETGRPFIEYADSIYELMTNFTTIAHNNSYDFNIIDGEFSKSGLPYKISYKQDYALNSEVNYKSVTQAQRAVHKQSIIDYLSSNETPFDNYEDWEKSNTLDAFAIYTTVNSGIPNPIDRSKHGALVDSELLNYVITNNPNLFSEKFNKLHKMQQMKNSKRIEMTDSMQKYQVISPEDEIPNQKIRSNIFFQTERINTESSLQEYEYFKKLQRLGITESTIIDTNISVAFPNIQKYAKEFGIKLNYGTIMEVELPEGGKDKVIFVAKNIEGYEEIKQLQTIAWQNNKTEPYLTLENIRTQSGGILERSFDLSNFKIFTQSNNDYVLAGMKSVFPGIEYIATNDSKVSAERLEELNIQSIHGYIPKYLNKEDLIKFEMVRRNVNSAEQGSFFNSEYIEQNYLSINKILESEKDLNTRYKNADYIVEGYTPDIDTKIFPNIKYKMDIDWSNSKERAQRQTEIFEIFKEKTRTNLQKRLDNTDYSPEKTKKVWDRVEYEFDILEKMENKQLGVEYPMAYAEYYLVVSDYVKALKKNGVLVGPGRGSGPGSICAFALDITDIDVIDNDLLFERFINEERISEPDFDVDFAGEINIEKDIVNEQLKQAVKDKYTSNNEKIPEIINGKDLALIYMSMTYNNSTVSKLVNENRYKPKSAIKQVIKDLGDDFVEKILHDYPLLKGLMSKYLLSRNNKNIPIEENFTYVTFGDFLTSTMSTIVDVDTFDKHLNQKRIKNKVIKPEDERYETDEAKSVSPEFLKIVNANIPEVNFILDLAQNLEGQFKNWGIHAGAVVIDTLNKEPMFYVNGELVCQRTKKTSKLIKYDFLGLKSLEVIKTALDAVEKHLGVKVDFNEIGITDKKTFELIAEGNTDGIPQISSEGMTQLCMDIGVSSLEELTAVIALYRPGPMDVEGMLDAYVRRSKGDEEVTYDLMEDSLKPLSDILNPVLNKTLGVVVYQEQVMAILGRIGGFSFGESDIVRRIMSDKNPVAMAEVKKTFPEKAVKFVKSEYGIDITEAQATLLFEKIEGFVGYGFNKSHAASYSKVVYETAFVKTHYPALFYLGNIENADNIEKIGERIGNALKNGIDIRKPNINTINDTVTPLNKDTLLLSMKDTKGFSKKLFNTIVDFKEEFGEITSVEYFLENIPSITAKNFDLINNIGAFDSIPFSVNGEVSKDPFVERLSKAKLASQKYNLKVEIPKNKEHDFYFEKEKTLVGEVLSVKKLIQNKGIISFIKYKNSPSIANISESEIGSQFENVFLMIDKITVRKIGGEDAAFISFMDINGETLDIPFWNQNYDKFKDILTTNALYSLKFNIKEYRDSKTVNLQNISFINTDKIIREDLKKEETIIENQPKASTTIETTVTKPLSSSSESELSDINTQVYGKVKNLTLEIIKSTVKQTDKGDMAYMLVNDINGKSIYTVVFASDYAKLIKKNSFEVGSVITISGNFQEFNGKDQLIINDCAPYKTQIQQFEQVEEFDFFTQKIGKKENVFFELDSKYNELLESNETSIIINGKKVKQVGLYYGVIRCFSPDAKAELETYLNQQLKLKTKPTVKDLFITTEKENAYKMYAQPGSDKNTPIDTVILNECIPQAIADNKHLKNGLAVQWFESLNLGKDVSIALLSILNYSAEEVKNNPGLLNDIDFSKEALISFLGSLQQIGIKQIIIPKQSLINGLNVAEILNLKFGQNNINGINLYISNNSNIVASINEAKTLEASIVETKRQK